MAKKRSSRKSNSRKRPFWRSWKFILPVAVIAILGYFYYVGSLPESKQNIASLAEKIEIPGGKTIRKGVERTIDKAKSLTDDAKEIAEETHSVVVETGQELGKKVAQKSESTRTSTTKTSSASRTETSPNTSSASKTSSTVHVSQLEIPISTVKRNEIILKKHGFTVSYNDYMRNPNWVAWELTRAETTGKEKRKNKFEPDPQLKGRRVTHDDYTHSRYDRGHMAPAADMRWSKRAMQESFYTSNICPQEVSLNRGDWNDLEELCRAWGKKYGTVHIACGPIYKSKNPRRLNKGNVAIPDRFFKVVLIYNRKNPIAMGFIFDNVARSQRLEKYMVTVDSVESLTGYDFFSKVPDSIEKRIEAVIPQLPAK